MYSLLWQTDAERDSTSTKARSRIWSLALLWSWCTHRQKSIGAGHESNRSQTSWIYSLRTGNDDCVADLNIGYRNCWQALKHVVDIEATTRGPLVRLDRRPWPRTLRLTTLRRRTAPTTWTAGPTASHENHPSSHPSRRLQELAQNGILFDHDRQWMLLPVR
jgi:hypothetical protein